MGMGEPPHQRETLICRAVIHENDFHRRRFESLERRKTSWESPGGITNRHDNRDIQHEAAHLDFLTFKDPIYQLLLCRNNSVRHLTQQIKRSEERRVGKECRSQRATQEEKKKKKTIKDKR